MAPSKLSPNKQFSALKEKPEDDPYKVLRNWPSIGVQTMKVSSPSPVQLTASKEGDLQTTIGGLDEIRTA